MCADVAGTARVLDQSDWLTNQAVSSTRTRRSNHLDDEPLKSSEIWSTENEYLVSTGSTDETLSTWRCKIQVGGSDMERDAVRNSAIRNCLAFLSQRADFDWHKANFLRVVPIGRIQCNTYTLSWLRLSIGIQEEMLHRENCKESASRAVSLKFTQQQNWMVVEIGGVTASEGLYSLYYIAPCTTISLIW